MASVPSQLADATATVTSTSGAAAANGSAIPLSTINANGSAQSGTASSQPSAIVPGTNLTTTASATTSSTRPTNVVNATNTAISNVATPANNNSAMPAIWSSVLKEHLDKLSEEEKRSCVPLPCDINYDQSAIAKMFGPIQSKYDKQAFSKFLSKVGPILEHVQSFGRAIDVAVGGSGTLGAGLIWGGIRLLLLTTARTSAIQNNIIGYIENLTDYLPLFERWTTLFKPKDYSDLASSIQRTCAEFFSYLVESLRFLSRSAFVNFLKVSFNPKYEKRFKSCQDRIDRYTKHLALEVNTAGLEDSQKQGINIIKLIETSSRPLPIYGAVTFPFRFVQNAPRNDQFFGREQFLTELDRHLRPDPTIDPPRMRSVVVHGLGGSGKSSVTKEYMYREFNAGRYDVIIWLYADSISKLEAQFIALARMLGIKAVESEARHAVLTWINQLDKEYLLVFDNADDPTLLKQYWPHTVHGSILITSRNPTAKEEGYAKIGMPLKVLDEKEGADFINSMLPTGADYDEANRQAIATLAKLFGGLPLALRQAASFMANKNCSPTKFLRIYEKRFEDIDSYQVEGYDKSVATTWTVSTDALSNDARIMLDALAILDPDAITTDLFDVSDLTLPYASFLADPIAAMSAQEGLRMQSLVDYDHNSQNLSIHRLLQHMTFSRLSKDRDRLLSTTDFVLRLINSYVPEIGFTAVRYPDNWKYVEKTLSHVQSIYARCNDVLVEDASALMLVCMTKVLCYAFESAQYSLGDWAYAQAIILTKRISEPSHEIFSLMYSFFSRLCDEMSRPKEGLDAIICAEKHIMIAADTNPELLKTGLYIRILTTLGINHTALGNWDEALYWHNKAVDTCIQLGMEKESSLGNLRQNLAGTYLWSGDLITAENCVRQALTEPNVSPMGANYTLGNILWKQGRIDEAVDVHRATLQRYSEVLGPNHPVPAGGWIKIGFLISDTRYSKHDLKEAEKCFRQAHEIWAGLAAANNNVDRFLARSKWYLARALEQLGEEHKNEYMELEREALAYLDKRFEGNIPNKDISEVFEDIMFYWSR